MLNEKIFFEKGQPYQVDVVRVQHDTMHYHEDMEFLYVMRGEVEVEHAGSTRTLSEGDVLVFNDLELHKLTGLSEDHMVMMLHLDKGYFDRYYPEMEESFFAIRQERTESVDVLRTLLTEIITEVLQKGPRFQEKIIEKAHNLIGILLHDHRFDEKEPGGDRKTNALALRVRRILRFMYGNYTRKLTLNEIAEREDLSLYYMSHMFKEATGSNYQDLLNYIRVEASEPMLLHTSEKIGNIACQVGFSAGRYYIRHFEQWYHMHPLEYRKKYAGHTVRHERRNAYLRSTPVRIEETIRRSKSEGAGGDPEPAGRWDVVTLTIDAHSMPDESKLVPVDLSELMERPVNRILAEPYMRFRRMGEQIIDAGSNYLVTTGQQVLGELESMSILLYNIDDMMHGSLKQVDEGWELLDLVSAYDTRMEFLLTFQGFSGTYRVCRYKMDRSCLTRRISDDVYMKGLLDSRERFLNEISAEPMIHIAEYKSSGTVSLRADFEGVGLEMIFIDKVKK